MTKPLVSICIPCHNASHYLPAALESVLGQSYSAIEIVAVDDSSVDDTGDILERYAASDGVHVHHVTFGSASKTRNFAFCKSHGEYVKYFDADDLLSSDMVELQVSRLVGLTDCVASSRWKRFVGDWEENPFVTDGTWADGAAVDWLVESMRNGGHRSMMQCGMFLIPRMAIHRLGGWDERLSLIDDTEFFGRIIAGCRRVLMTDGVLYYRSSLPGSLSRRTSTAAYQSAVLSVGLFCDHLLAIENSSRTRRTAADLCQAWKYEISPHEPQLTKPLDQRIAILGGSALSPSGGPLFHAVASVLGWRTTSRLRCWAKAVGYANLRTAVSGK